MTRQQKAELRKINLEVVTGTSVFIAFMLISLTLWSALA